MPRKSTPVRRVALMSEVTAARIDALAERLGVSKQMALTWLVAQSSLHMMKGLDIAESPEMLKFLGQQMVEEVDGDDESTT